MKILFVIHTPKNLHTAVYGCYHQLSGFLGRNGHQATVVAPEDFPNLRRRHARWYPLLYPFWVVAYLRRHAGEFDVAVFHSYSGWLAQTIRRWLPSLRHVRMLTAFHGLEPLHYRRLSDESDRCGAPLRRRFRFVHGLLVPWMLRLGCRRADRILCLNSQEVRYLADHAWAKPLRISLMPNGVPREFLADRSYTDSARRLLFVGQWQPMKGVRQLADCFNQLARDYPDIELRCVGTLKEPAAVLADFSDQSRGRVSVVSRVPREELAHEYRQADIFVFPTHSEGFSNALLEAMATGLPVVTTPVGAALDLLQSEYNALLVPACDTQSLRAGVERLIADRALRERLGRQARATAERYEIDFVHDRYRRLLETADWNGSVVPEMKECVAT